MRIEPEFSDFEKSYKAGKSQVVVTRLVADLETPVGAYLKLSKKFGPGFLLESVEGGAARGRYSILGFAPDLIFRVKDGKPEINRQAAQNPHRFNTLAGNIFDELRDMLAESHIDLPESLPAMAAGVFGLLGYDIVRFIEKIGLDKSDPLELPQALLVRPTLTVVFDTVRDEIILIATCRPGLQAAREIYGSCNERLEAALDALKQSPPIEETTSKPSALPAPQSNTDKQRYFDMVERAKEYIFAGDAFQIVLSQRFETEFTLPPFLLYRALRRVNPSPYLFFFDFDEFAIAGSSPEICVKLSGDKITLRPIAGTIRRGKTTQEDRAQGEKLLADPKERAEHLMLLDLGRNDVGRVAKIGSVKVEEQYKLEHYSEVIHIVSQVGGTIDAGHDAIDVLKAAFPAGTLSGAPKVRAMQIINELEKDARGFYGGCVGYFSAGGDMDTAITLRAGLIKDGKLYVQAGGGVVADSTPEGEFAETAAKARAVFRAAEEAIKDAGAA